MKFMAISALLVQAISFSRSDFISLYYLYLYYLRLSA